MAEQLSAEFKKIIARQSHLAFTRYCWNEKSPFSCGFHTEKIANKIDEALKRFNNGEEVYLMVNVPFRHGKTKGVEYAIALMIGMFPMTEVLYATHTNKLAMMVSRNVRRIVQSKKFQALFPTVFVNPKSQAVDRWEIVVQEGDRLVHKGGAFNVTSISSGTAGIGAELLILDDVFANRATAESEVARDNAWNFFTNDFLSRANPPANGRGSLVFVVGTPWHVDDPFGRIEKAMDEDEEFPQFEILRFPAEAKFYEGDDEYPGEYLFSKIRTFHEGKPRIAKGRITPAWYKSKFASLSKADASSLLNCRPINKTGGLIETELIKWYDSIDSFPDSGIMRVVDFAHSDGVSKNGRKNKADFTGATKMAFKRGAKMPDSNLYYLDLYIYDYQQIRASSVKRDEFLYQLAQEDGVKVTQVYEKSLDSMDAINGLISRLGGRFRCKAQEYKSSKASRIEPVLPLFEVGRVHVFKFADAHEWLYQIASFCADESGKAHDEAVDNISCGWKYYNDKVANSYQRFGNIRLG